MKTTFIIRREDHRGDAKRHLSCFFFLWFFFLFLCLCFLLTRIHLPFRILQILVLSLFFSFSLFLLHFRLEKLFLLLKGIGGKMLTVAHEPSLIALSVGRHTQTSLLPRRGFHGSSSASSLF